jgi:hypothetical protein
MGTKNCEFFKEMILKRAGNWALTNPHNAWILTAKKSVIITGNRVNTPSVIFFSLLVVFFVKETARAEFLSSGEFLNEHESPEYQDNS